MDTKENIDRFLSTYELGDFWWMHIGRLKNVVGSSDAERLDRICARGWSEIIKLRKQIEALEKDKSELLTAIACDARNLMQLAAAHLSPELR